MTYKIVINNRYGCFGLSDEAKRLFLDKMGIIYDVRKEHYYDNFCYTKSGNDINFDYFPRHNSALVETVEELGKEASDSTASLIVVESQTRMYRIEENDGKERIIEFNSSEFIDAEKL